MVRLPGWNQPGAEQEPRQSPDRSERGSGQWPRQLADGVGEPGYPIKSCAISDGRLAKRAEIDHHSA